MDKCLQSKSIDKKPIFLNQINSTCKARKRPMTAKEAIISIKRKIKIKATIDNKQEKMFDFKQDLRSNKRLLPDEKYSLKVR